MAKSYRPYFPEQDFLLPPSLREWLPEDHLAYFVSDVIDQLDLGAIEAHYEREERGYPPYHPRMMTKVLVYGYCVGVFSSRRLEKRLVEDIAFRVLAAGNEPDFRTISEFRRVHLKALEGLFVQVLRLALKLGAMKLGRVAIDGTKIKANASKHKAMSYERMLREEARLQEEAKRLLAEAEQTDKDEDKRYGRNRQGDELPAELGRREERLKRIAEAKKALEARAEAEQKQKAKKPEKKDPPHHGGRRGGRSAVEPKAEAQHNFTDPESRIMKGPDGFVQAYNAQAAVEPGLQLIVAQALTQQANDKQQLIPMIERVREQAGQKVQQVLADSGYCSEENLRKAGKKKVDLYIATGKQKHNQPAQTSPRGRIPQSATLVDRMKRKLMTKAGRIIYARRKTIVEPVFGQIKQAQGFRQFLLRGVEKVCSEWALVCTTHNVLKLYRACTE
jgi:transposase